MFPVADYEPWKHTKSRSWKAPDYSDQEKTLGYKKEAFTPYHPLIKESVDFWIDIYSKYTVDQGVLHDSIHESLVYEVVDFSDIMRMNISLREKQRLRLKRVKNRKRQVRKTLLRLSRVRNPSNLKGQMLAYWNLFKPIKEKRKFLVARHRNRLRFQLGQKNLILKGIFNSGAYIEEMESIFRKHNLPTELIRLVFVESSFNLNARSSAGASGIWQFIKTTAKPYLRMNLSVDERLDPLSATEASAKLLKRNYNRLKSWPLAITAYNRGLAGVQRLLKRKKAKSLEELLDARRGKFRFASANFYTSFLAILEVEKNAKKYFGRTIRWRHPVKTKKIRLNKTISHKTLISWFGGDKAKAKQINTHIKSSVWDNLVRIGKGNFVRVYEEREREALKELKQLKSLKLYRGRLYRIKKNDTLSAIAQRFKVTVKKIKDQNPGIKERFLKRGRLIVVPRK